MGPDDPKSLAERLKTIVQYRLALVRGSALAGDHAGAYDLLRYGLWKDLCAWAAELQSDELFLSLPDLAEKWAGEHCDLLRQAVPPLPPEWADEKSKAGPGGAMLIDAGHQEIVRASLLAQVDVKALNAALQSLELVEPAKHRFKRVVRLLLDAPPVVRLVPREAAAKASGNNGN